MKPKLSTNSQNKCLLDEDDFVIVDCMHGDLFYELNREETISNI